MGCCGQGRVPRNTRGEIAAAKREHVDPTRAAFSAAAIRYLVVPNQTSTTGKQFSTFVAAQDYARKTGGIIRQL